MSEVLSQNQIDALLKTMQGDGPEEAAPKTEEKEAPQYRKYDFNTPKKFTKDRLRVISSVYENYARIVASHLTSMLRLGCEVEMISVEEQRYYEFDNALGEDNLLVFSNIKLQTSDEDEEEPMMMVLSPSVVYSMLNRMLGGQGEPEDEEDTSGSAYSDIEMAVYETILKHIIPVMDDMWQNYLGIEFKYHRIESNPKLVQAISVDDVVVIVMMNISINNVSGQITICLPGNVLDVIFRNFEQALSNANRRRDNQTAEEKEQLLRGVETSLLEIKAQFAEAIIALEDVYEMQVGDLINLHIPKHSEVQLSIEDNPWFTGKLGVYKENKAVKIVGTIEDEMRAEE